MLGGVQVRVGPWVLGFIQTVIDRIKLLSKRGNNNIFRILFVTLSLVVFNTACSDVLIILMILRLLFLRISILSENKYSMYRGIRMIILMISFEILLIVSLLGERLIVVLLLLFMLLIDGGRTPVDLVEGESELVSGFNTEYSGVLFTLFFMGEILILICFFIQILPWYRILFSLCFLIMSRAS